MTENVAGRSSRVPIHPLIIIFFFCGGGGRIGEGWCSASNCHLGVKGIIFLLTFLILFMKIKKFLQ